MDTIILILNIIGLVFLFRWGRRTWLEFRATPDKRAFFTFRRFRNSLGFAALVILPLLIANFLFPGHIPTSWIDFFRDENLVWLTAIGLSFLISGIWFIYVWRLDIYDSEQWWHLLLTFILSALATGFLTIPMYEVVHRWGFQLDGMRIINDFLYSVFVIGGIEEFTKLLPILFMLLFFPKALNEPFDYILYGSVSALGFAFVENVNYIYFSDLYNIGGRALYAIVAHMTFTSTVCYGLMLVRFDYNKVKGYILIPAYFLLAMAAHGFYDFWLINQGVERYASMTTVFFLITVHLWFTMKNNAINISNFYDPEVVIKNDRLRTYLIFSLTGLFMLAYLILAVKDGPENANRYMWFGVGAYGYLIFYFAFGLSRYKIVQDRLNPFNIPFDFFVPKPKKSEKAENSKEN